ncbi:hypothetical protein BG015_007404 [Linnemannia schmuckeri]|uniref:Uncharacterized protein n=1 Tax=Linnemannia schmuckeri TaxID=64567 RepID=A0A9P5S189_9FUNG|nr:hypothetical protein BG015_007404 [Linnemannia schmuckeri]
MSTSSSQGNQPLQPSPTTSLSKEQQKSANDGKRSLSQLERTTKVGRTSPSVGSISDALQRISLTNIDIEDPSMMSTSLPLENTSPLPADSKRTESGRYRVFPQGRHEVLAVTYSPLGQQIALCADRYVKLRDEQTGGRQHRLKHDGFVQYAAYSSCGRWIAVGCNNAVWIWSCTLDQTWKCRKILPCFFSTIKDIAWRPGMREFVTGCRDGSIHVWKLENESSELSVRMVWSTGRPGFVATDAVIADTIGLSPINREFLRQRGANDESPPSPSLSSSDSDEEFAEDLGPWLSPVAWDFQ